MTWEKLLLENTTAPYGIEKSGNIIYLKVLLNKDNTNHNFIKDRIEFIESVEAKEKGNNPIASNIRMLKDGNYLLRIRINVFKNRKLVKMNYGKNCLKEDYLKSIDELHLDSKIHVKISIGSGYIFKIDNLDHFGLNITVDEVTIL